MDTIDQGRWLHALIMEREGIKDPPEGGAIYENQQIASQLSREPVTDEDGNELYEEVYDVQITTGKGDKLGADTAHALSKSYICDTKYKLASLVNHDHCVVRYYELHSHHIIVYHASHPIFTIRNYPCRNIFQ